jgi:hypothetical protein
MKHLARIWRWLTNVTTIRTRRVTLIGWLVLLTFSAPISRFAVCYRLQIEAVLGLAIIACSLGGLVLLAGAAWKGRSGRSRR